MLLSTLGLGGKLPSETFTICIMQCSLLVTILVWPRFTSCYNAIMVR